MKCALCEGKMRRAKVNVPLERNNRLVHVRGVPGYRCGRCGEVWLPDDIAARLEEIFKEAVKNGVEMELVRYSPVS